MVVVVAAVVAVVVVVVVVIVGQGWAALFYLSVPFVLLQSTAF